METINITKARQNLYQLVKQTNMTHQPVHITGKEGDAVLMSEADWRSIEETLYLNAVPGLVGKILAGDREPANERVNADDLEW